MWFLEYSVVVSDVVPKNTVSLLLFSSKRMINFNGLLVRDHFPWASHISPTKGTSTGYRKYSVVVSDIVPKK